MDDKTLKFLAVTDSPVPAAVKAAPGQTPNKRVALHKKNGNTANLRTKTRTERMETRDRKKDEMGMRRRGISMKSASSEDEENEGNHSVPQVKKKTAEERLQKMQQFKLNRQAKKTAAEAEMKRPPWKPGGTYKDEYRPWTMPKELKLKDLWTKEPNTQNKVVVFKADNKKEERPKPEASKGRQATKVAPFSFQLDKRRPKREATKEIPLPKMAPVQEDKQVIVANEFEQLQVKDSTDEEAEEAKDAVPEPIFRTPVRKVGTPKPVIEQDVVQVTPKMKLLMERGTNSDKRRQRMGKTPSKTPAEILGISDEEEEKKDVPYFKRILEENDQKLTQLCGKWEEKMEKLAKNMKNYEDNCSNIRSTIGKANLLMNKKGRFEQFRGLIQNCEQGLGEKKTTCMDLQGFWEMIYFQVEDVEQKFKELEELEARNWTKDEPKASTMNKPVLKKSPVSKPFKPKAKASSNLRAMMAEKRKAMMKKQEAPVPAVIVEPPTEEKKKIEEEVKFDAGFFNVVTSPKSPLAKPKSVDRVQDLRKSLLHKRVSMSCGVNASSPLAIIAATKSIRRSMSRENTPTIAIKLDYDDECKENIESPMTSLLGPPRKSIAVPKDNLMCFDSPSISTPRRSQRLSSAQKINYNEHQLFKNSLHPDASPALNERSRSKSRGKSPRRSPRRSPKPSSNWND